MSKKTELPHLSRRALLQGMLGGAATYALWPIRPLLAQDAAGHRFVACFLDGGWDVLLAGDPRDPAGSYEGIDLGLNLLAAEFADPFPVSMGGTEQLWGPTMRALQPHADLATFFRGINMNTVSHETAKSYSHTGRQPAGALARGDSIGTVAAAVHDNGTLLPNAAISIPSYNRAFDNRFSAIRMNDPREIRDLIGATQGALPEGVEDLLHKALEDAYSCVSPAYSGRLPEDELHISRDRIKRLQQQDVVARFDFNAETAEMDEIRALYPLDNGSGRATATAAQLLLTDLSAAVTTRVRGGYDTHGVEWANDQPQRLVEAFEAIGAMLTHLRNDDPSFERTTVLVYSEFARTPKINGDGGRDHWFADTMMVFGSTLKKGVFGASNEQDLGILALDPVTGRPDEGGIQLRPEHVMATLVQSLGGDPSPYREDPLTAWIEKELTP
ncbi:MAG: DUF1501 domain-containing protein [Myxococcales bacterium]|nr:MAG: DUF1501 domain-containing protein [Myxococcales bacterium]